MDELAEVSGVSFDELAAPVQRSPRAVIELFVRRSLRRSDRVLARRTSRIALRFAQRGEHQQSREAARIELQRRRQGPEGPITVAGPAQHAGETEPCPDIGGVTLGPAAEYLRGRPQVTGLQRPQTGLFLGRGSSVDALLHFGTLACSCYPSGHRP